MATYKSILDNLFLALVFFDREGYLTYMNEMAKSILALPDDYTSRRFHCSEFSETSWLDIQEVIQTGEPQIGKYVRVNNATMLCSRIPVNQGGVVIGVLSSIQFMTEYENTIETLQKDKELLKRVQAIIESSYDGIYVTDGQANTIMVNSAYEKMTGFKRDVFVGRNMYDLVKEGFFNKSVTLNVLQSRKQETIRQILRSGKEILATGTPIFDDNGNIIMVVTNDRDMSDLMKVHQQLEHSLEIAMAYKEELHLMQQSDLFGKDFVVISRTMHGVCDLVERVSKTDATVLLCGETGVGKDRLAEELHKRSLRHEKGLFVKINCSAIPEALIESELFGYEGGAFTGARKEGKVGLFELANGGTLFLDEVETMPISLQPKLLRVLQNFEISRVGSTVPKKVDVRLVCATNMDLKDMVARNQFRADLYYRLNVISILIPPLRERREDIPALVTFFINQFNQKYKKKKSIGTEVMNVFTSYSWPGNVREIANVIERLVVTVENKQIGLQDLPLELYGKEVSAKIKSGLTVKQYMREEEISLLKNAVKTYGSARKAAAAIGLDHSTITRKLKKHGLPV
ncbi:MAG: sigma 54-interacting transcriptional regulator [Smithella sp.]